MADFADLIFDRTQADVDYALTALAEFRKDGYAPEDLYLRGCLNARDINRIEECTQKLKNELVPYYYFPNTTSMVSWNRGSLPNTNDISRIISNVQKIIAAFRQDETAPPLPDTMLTYEQLNSIEKNLSILYSTFLALKSYVESNRQCGTFNCGEEV